MRLFKPIIKKVKNGSFLNFLFKIFFYWCLRLLFFTYRLEIKTISGKKINIHEPQGIFYFWHQHILSGMFFFFKQRAQGACVVSPSGDGKFAGFICEKLGFTVLYGSGHKASITVTRQALAALKTTGRLCLVGDGSRGPAKQLQPGLLFLAKKSGQPLVFVDCQPARAVTVKKSWDQFKI